MTNELDFDFDDSKLKKSKPISTNITMNNNNIKSMSKLDLYQEFIEQKKSILDYVFANVDNYKFKTWKECFPDNKVNLKALIFNSKWNEFFEIISSKKYYHGIERILSGFLENNKDIILPYGELVFNSLNILSPEKIRVVIIGQDPYPAINKINQKNIPQAMGFSFSVPLGYPKPKSLENIYNNLLHFNHLKKIPETGCLAMWILQGCFMINSTFTTFNGQKNVHKNIWKDFTNDLLSYINKKCENVVFLVWGKDAHIKCLNIDPKRHHIITSSHPSPLGFDKTFSGFIYGNSKNKKSVTYPSFKLTDHFGQVNTYLKSIGKIEILWDLIDI